MAGNLGSLPDDARVVRGGLVTPERVQEAAEEEPDGTRGISVQCAPGLSAHELARVGRIPHSRLSVSTVGRSRALGGRALGAGFAVRPTPGPGRHATLIIPSRPVSAADAHAIAAAFDPLIPNPVR